MSHYKSPFEILGIEKTNDLKIIKKAYAMKAKECHPEEHPEAFIELQNAYKKALSLAKSNRLFNEVKPNPLSSIAITERVEQEIIENNDDIKEEKPSPIFPHSSYDLPLKKENYQRFIYNNKMIEIEISNPNFSQEKEYNLHFDSNIYSTHLSRLDTILKSRFTTRDITSFLNDSDLKLLFNDSIFKAKVEQSFIKYEGKIKKNKKIIEIVKHIAIDYQMPRLESIMTKSKSPDPRFRPTFFLFVLILSSCIYLANRPSFQSNSQNQSSNTSQSVNQSVTQSLELGNTDLLGQTNNKYNMALNGLYLNGVEVSYENSNYTLLDKGGNNLVDKVITDVGYTKSHLLLLQINQKYQVYNTETKTLSEDIYSKAKATTVYNSDDNALNTLVIVAYKDDFKYVISEDGVTLIDILDLNGNTLYFKEQCYSLE